MKKNRKICKKETENIISESCKSIQKAYDNSGNKMCPEFEFEMYKEIAYQTITTDFCYILAKNFRGAITLSTITFFYTDVLLKTAREIDVWLFCIIPTMIALILYSIAEMCNEKNSNPKNYIKSISYSQYRKWYEREYVKIKFTNYRGGDPL